MNVVFVLVGAVLGIVLAIGWWWLDDARVLVRLQAHAAPAGLVYAGESGHGVVLARIDNHLGDVQGYEVWLGRAVNSDTPYGHVVEVPDGWDAQNMRVDWLPDGVGLVFADAGRIFVPDDQFTGGR
ncbi:hypothetical protein HUO13_17080 [Saccharopolyspora erythraea]|nr:hypothetical protein HUO13_17080 [Saccharopolyspora erythraea]